MFRFAAFALLSIAIGTGCASRSAQPVITPAETASSDAADDPTFSPPDESGMTIVEKKGEKQKTLGDRSERNEKVAPATNIPTPNARKQSGASVHAATK
jgi:hypothetical protein